MSAVLDRPRGVTLGRALGWSALGTVSVRLVNVSASIVMAHLLLPDQFGSFAVALSVWLVLGTVAELGLGADLVRAQDPEAKAATVATLGLLAGVFFAVTMASLATAVAAAFGSPQAAGLIRLMAVSLVLAGLGIVPAARLQRDYRQGAVVGVNATGALVSAATMTALAATGTGAASLAWGQVVGQGVIVVGMHVVARMRPRFGFTRSIARGSLLFCVPLASANMLSWVLLTVDNLVVARTLGPSALGLYVLAFNVSSWPMAAIGQSVRVVALPAFAQMAAPGGRARSLLRVIGPVGAISALVAMLLATLAGPVVALLYGPRWHEVTPALVGLAVFGGIRVVFDLVATFLIAVGTTTAVLVVQGVWLVAMVPVMVWGVGRFGLAGAGWSHVVVAVVVVLPAYLLCLERVGVDVRRLLRAWLGPVACLVPAACVCWWIGRQDAPALLLLLAGGCAGTFVYAAPMARGWTRDVRALRAPTSSPTLATTNGTPR